MKTFLQLIAFLITILIVSSCSKTDSEDQNTILNTPTIVGKWEYSKQASAAEGPFTDYPTAPNCAKKNEEFKENNNAIIKDYSGVNCTETIRYAIYEVNGNELKTTAAAGRGFTIRTIISLSFTEMKLKDGDIIYILNKKN